MRYLSFLIFLLIVAYVVWPYYTVYRLDNAVKSNDQTTLTELVDLKAIRELHKESIQRNVSQLENNLSRTTGAESNPLLDTIRDGIIGIGRSAVDKEIDINWVKSCLAGKTKDKPSLWHDVSFAFYESPTRFTIRIGELGQAPTFVQMILQDWSWRVAAVYDCS